MKNARKNSKLTDASRQNLVVQRFAAEELTFCCRYLVADSGNFDTAVFGFVLAVEINDYTRESFDDVGVAGWSAIESPRTDALNDFDYFLLCFRGVTANQHISERGAHVAQVHGGNIMERADDRSLSSEDLLCFL